MLLLFIVGISAYAFGPEPESTCSVVEYDQTISGEAQFRSTEFTCVKGNGDFLSYGFDNTAGADCMVELYKKGLIWDTKAVSYTHLFIAAEDTRVTVKLLNHLGLKKPMVSYYRHNTGTCLLYTSQTVNMV